mmetsp:Transcript_35792/g.104751  ORF Transcript_35792/g.104751 Transcript_35792/m.104751 type:complete len:242 (+) Transcript_35792:335-1060(+)
MRWRCRWKTLWPAASPLFVTTRKSSSPSCFATAAATVIKWPRMPECSAVAAPSPRSPARTFGMMSTCVGATGLMSLNARHLASSYTMSLGIFRPMIASKMVGSAVSRAPAPSRAPHRPLASQLRSTAVISSRTRIASSSTVVMCAHHARSFGPSAPAAASRGCDGGAPSGVMMASSNRGSMYVTKTIVGKSVASAREISLPVRYGPSLSVRSSATAICARSARIASARELCAPNGDFSASL